MRLTARHGFVASILLGCSSAEPPPATAAAPPEKCVAPRPRVSVTASPQVNAGPDGRGLPVQVRLYQLKSESKLLNAFFEEVWRDDAKTLAEDLVTKRELTAFPGQTERFTLDQSPDSRVLAAVALFREPRGKDWFVSYDLVLARQEPPCPPPEPSISIWLDRMKIQDGEGRVQGGEGAPVEAEPNNSGGSSSSTLGGARAAVGRSVR
ncbi:MAG TPA: type VI secretion system lipoprotein TssJ [Polyangiaceae bacterium]|nr:type VI secretion system lipoprotein TssJ [Polyangiaceae bacterium]